MEAKLESQEYRLKIIEEIKGNENNERMEKSQQEWDVFSGNIRPYVKKKLLERFSQTLVSEIPIVASINVLKKAVKAKGSLYNNPPTRDFTELSDDQKEIVELAYKDMRIDAQMMQLNRLFELQEQTHGLIEPKNGRLTLRPVKSHQLNVKPSDLDPEIGEIYIFSSYDKSQSNIKQDSSDGTNQKIADLNDYEKEDERYFVWSKSFHFVMDGNGENLSNDTASPLLAHGVVPVVEFASLKDFTYWIEGTNEDAQFTVDYNSSQSMLGQIVEMQGFAQAFLKTTADLMPASIDVGPTRILKLVVDPNVDAETEFGFASPNSDISGAREYSESLLSQYLSSQGQSPGSISANATDTEKFTSGTDRFLAQIEKFESSKDAMDIFSHGESAIYKVIKAWLNVLSTSDLLLPKYRIKGQIKAESELMIEYKMPTAVLTKMEKLDVLEREIELELKTKVEAYAEYRGVTEKEAEELLKDVEEETDDETPGKSATDKKVDEGKFVKKEGE